MNRPSTLMRIDTREGCFGGTDPETAFSPPKDMNRFGQVNPVDRLRRVCLINSVWFTKWITQGLVVSLIGAGGASLPRVAIAHGVTIEYRSIPAIEINATYDSGEPMANAQVIVFSPENPSEPWLAGTTNDQGQFIFKPDETLMGNWDVQIRQAGHGDIASIPFESVNGSSDQWIASGSSANLSPIQKGIMAGSVIWGLIGTALFFSARLKKHAHS